MESQTRNMKISGASLGYLLTVHKKGRGVSGGAYQTSWRGQPLALWMSVVGLCEVMCL